MTLRKTASIDKGDRAFPKRNEISFVIENCQCNSSWPHLKEKQQHYSLEWTRVLIRRRKGHYVLVGMVGAEETGTGHCVLVIAQWMGKGHYVLVEAQWVGKRYCVWWNVSQWEKDTMFGRSQPNDNRSIMFWWEPSKQEQDIVFWWKLSEWEKGYYVLVEAQWMGGKTLCFMECQSVGKRHYVW